jgi:dihydroorotate dehydrogenase (fumarate)
LRWIAILRGRVDVDLAGTTGVHDSEGALKLLLAGANAVMLASALLRRGAPVVRELLEGMERWMEEREYESVAQLQGSLSQVSCPDPAAFERANYMRALVTYAP